MIGAETRELKGNIRSDDVVYPTASALLSMLDGLFTADEECTLGFPSIPKLAGLSSRTKLT